MEPQLGLFLGVIAFLALIQWAWGRRSRGKNKSGSSDYDGTWTDNSVAPESASRRLLLSWREFRCRRLVRQLLVRWRRL